MDSIDTGAIPVPIAPAVRHQYPNRAPLVAVSWREDTAELRQRRRTLAGRYELGRRGS